ncbi:MAG: SIS domain-containing protein [Actinobacteria bacterium]|nr:SIS domain-containing protein [Actinomycetota bacterium]
MNGMGPDIDLFLSEICEQPQALIAAAAGLDAQRASLARLADAAATRPPLILTGMGSSFDACLATASALARHGLLSTAINSAELLHFRLDAIGPDALVVAISQSGNSIELVRIAEALTGRAERPRLVSITNGLDNPLARAADITLDTCAGLEQGPSTKTFAATFVLVQALVASIAGARPVEEITTAVATEARLASDAAAALLREPVALADRMYEALAGRPSLVVVGRGTARAAAEMAGLVLKEAAQVQAESLDTGEFRHGPLELAGPELGIAVIATEGRTRELDLALAGEVAASGAATVVIASEDGGLPSDSIAIGPVEPVLAPAVAVIPLQLLAWRIAREKGRDPGRFTLATKVTTRE